MKEHKTKLVVLVCEEALEPLVLPDFLAAGATGYTVSEVRGRGNRGVRDTRWALSSNVRIETLCSEAVGRQLIELVERKYAAHYGLVIYMADVVVHQPDKF